MAPSAAMEAEAATCPVARPVAVIQDILGSQPGRRGPLILKGKGIFGLAADLKSRPLKTVEKMAALGDLVEVGLPLSPVRIYFLNSPALVDEMLVKQHRLFSKSMRGYDVMRNLLGNGLVTSEHELWAKQRRLMNPAFGKVKLSGFGDTIVKKTNYWMQAVEQRQGAAFDVHADMLQLTLAIIGETLLSTDMQSGSQVFSRALKEILGQMIWRALAVAPLPLSVPTPANLRFRYAKYTLDRIISGIIRQRLQGEEKGDLLGMLLAATDPQTGEAMSASQLADEVMTIFFAGHETTASALTWTLFTLAEHPEVETALAAELRSVLAGRLPTSADVARLPYLGAVLKETLRLYPPVWMVPRVAEQTTELEGTLIAKGSYVFCSPYFLHRREQEWKNANAFLPERWLAPEWKPVRSSYVPFLQGPRRCIGEGFATMEMTLVLATLLQRFSLRRASAFAPELEPEVTLKPHGGMPMRAIAR